MGPPGAGRAGRGRAQRAPPQRPGRRMSVEAVLARVNELQQMIGAQLPTQPANTQAFASQLQNATTSAAISGTTPTDATAGTASLTSTGAVSELPADVPYGA